MRRFVLLFILSAALCAECVSCGGKQESGRSGELDQFFNSKKVTIAITDSGLGGLSITADAVRKMEKYRIFDEVEIIFYNALFSTEGGYNSLVDRKEKIRIFDRALAGLRDHYDPDIIIIGCNTLSVIYGETGFASGAGMPVVGIVDTGVEMMLRSIGEEPDSKVIIFGTKTTIDEGSYRSKLKEAGISDERIIDQACPDLTNYIERGYDSYETELLIGAYVGEALEKAGEDPGTFFASLNCTHYGYSMELWKAAFDFYEAPPEVILNPNDELVDFLFPQRLRNRNEMSKITVRVVSKVRIEQSRLESIAGLIGEISPETAEALLGYEFKEDLFVTD